jgi:trigger factor
MRLNAQGIDAGQWLQATGQTEQQLVDGLREGAVDAVKVDLGLRAVADAEDIECTDEDLDDEFARIAERVREKPERVRREFERNDQTAAVRSDIRKRKALDWLVEHVELVDEQGQPIDREALTLDEPTEDEELEAIEAIDADASGEEIAEHESAEQDPE